ncbi:hypothetical protein JQ628_09510 [Bradyrhizobium lablabi]|uniref:hypothetical protein n=1 Tax=Bradyrhizobium lablabi TaxID=722472 RepID=UPI001BA8228F|nr:hypothetical protein [Bradyrhizobium lablabi]MBR1121745.1 hypothetical protein [Bradyrhizobium lablabi]
MIMLRTALILTGLTAFSLQAFAGGPVYTYRHELPPAIARLHSCIGPHQRTLRDPEPWHVGKRRMFRVGCPENAPDINRLPHRDDTGHVRKPDDDPDHFQSMVYYLADDARGRHARRLVLPYPRADGTMLMTDAFDEELDIGWSSRANTSLASGLAYLDLTGTAIQPPGEFMVATRIVPVDRPEIKNVFAMWRVRKDKAELIYWAETRETLPKDAPSHQSPPYEIVLDKRPGR